MTKKLTKYIINEKYKENVRLEDIIKKIIEHIIFARE